MASKRLLILLVALGTLAAPLPASANHGPMDYLQPTLVGGRPDHHCSKPHTSVWGFFVEYPTTRCEADSVANHLTGRIGTRLDVATPGEGLTTFVTTGSAKPDLVVYHDLAAPADALRYTVRMRFTTVRAEADPLPHLLYEHRRSAGSQVVVRGFEALGGGNGETSVPVVSTSSQFVQESEVVTVQVTVRNESRALDPGHFYLLIALESGAYVSNGWVKLDVQAEILDITAQPISN